MKLLERHTKELLRHALQNFLVVCVLTGLAVALDLLDNFLTKLGVSAWLLACIGVISRIVYAFDATLFLMTLGLTGAHFVREYYRILFKRNR